MPSAEFFSIAQKLIPGGVNSPVRAFRAVGGQPFFTQSAKGPYLFTADGRQLLDYVCTWGPAILGHAPQPVLDAVSAAASNGLSFGTPNPAEVQMAQILCKHVPSLEKVRLVNSGTEATMSCIRLARGFTNRPRILKFNGCYHGHVDSLLVKAGSGPLTFGQPNSAGIPSELAALTSSLPFNDIEALQTYFHHFGSQTAAVILEPIPANAGLYLPNPNFLHKLRSLCSHYESLLIFDEVMTGFRVHPGGAQALYNITPDLTALGKVIGGGLPIGAFGGKAEIMDFLAPDGPVYQAGTLSGNPLSLAAGIAQLLHLEQTNAWQTLESIGAQLEDALRPILHQKPLTFHRIGSMFCLYFHPGPIHNLESAQQADTAAFARFFHACLEKGIYLPPSQFEACFLSTAHTPDTIELTAKTFAAALKQIL